MNTTKNSLSAVRTQYFFQLPTVEVLNISLSIYNMVHLYIVNIQSLNMDGFCAAMN